MHRAMRIVAVLALALPGLAAAQPAATPQALTAPAATPQALTAPAATPQALTAKECGACHLAFPANQLPARSWTAVMAGLADHFGENAALDAATRQVIERYLTANAADAAGGRRKVLRGLAETQTPLRITEVPYWQREHRGKVTPQKLASAKAKSQVDCAACHAGAARGRFDDD